MCGIVAILNVKEQTHALRDKDAIKREQSDACIYYAERERLRCEASN